MVTETVGKILEKEAETDSLIADARNKADELVSREALLTEEKCRDIIRNAEAEANGIIETAKAQADKKNGEALAEAARKAELIASEAAPKADRAYEIIRNTLFE